MSRSTKLLLVVLCLLINACNIERSPFETFDADDFALYLMADTTLSVVQLYQAKLDTLDLSDKPLFNLNELNYYRWKDHSLSINNNGIKNIKNLVNNRRSVYGIPFVIVAQESRRYLGAFWFAYSSVVPTFPYIESSQFIINNPNPSVITIEKGWSVPIDVRNDSIVYQVLKRANKLIE